MYTKHKIGIIVTDHLNNTLDMDYDFPMECNFLTAVSALNASTTYLLQALDAYARTKGYSSAKEMPRKFKETLKMSEVLAAYKG